MCKAFNRILAIMLIKESSVHPQFYGPTILHAYVLVQARVPPSPKLVFLDGRPVYLALVISEQLSSSARNTKSTFLVT